MSVRGGVNRSSRSVGTVLLVAVLLAVGCNSRVGSNHGLRPMPAFQLEALQGGRFSSHALTDLLSARFYPVGQQEMAR